MAQAARRSRDSPLSLIGLLQKELRESTPAIRARAADRPFPLLDLEFGNAWRMLLRCVAVPTANPAMYVIRTRRIPRECDLIEILWVSIHADHSGYAVIVAAEKHGRTQVRTSLAAISSLRLSSLGDRCESASGRVPAWKQVQAADQRPVPALSVRLDSPYLSF